MCNESVCAKFIRNQRFPCSIRSKFFCMESTGTPCRSAGMSVTTLNAIDLYHFSRYAHTMFDHGWRWFMPLRALTSHVCQIIISSLSANLISYVPLELYYYYWSKNTWPRNSQGCMGMNGYPLAVRKAPNNTASSWPQERHNQGGPRWGR